MAKEFSLAASSLLTKYAAYKTTMDATTAKQGRYTGYSSLNVGVIRFGGLHTAGIDWSKKRIRRITLRMRHGTSGRTSGDKDYQLWPSSYQTDNNPDVTGLEFIGDKPAFGRMSLPSPANTDVYITLPDDSQDMFDAIAAYIQGGNDTFCLYIDESLGGASYTRNYLTVTEAGIVIEYEDETAAWFGKDGSWVKCQAFYGKDGAWKPVFPAFGSGGEWKRT